MSKEKKNFWPQSIAALLGTAALLIVWTVVKTSTMPVHEENLFMTSYQDVDLNSGKYITQNKKFFDKYEINIISNYEEKEIEGFYKNRKRMTNHLDKTKPLILQIVAKDEGLFDSNMQVALTRPTTTADDKKVSVEKLQNNQYSLDLTQIDKEGRWQLVVQARVKEFTGYKNIDIYIQ